MSRIIGRYGKHIPRQPYVLEYCASNEVEGVLFDRPVIYRVRGIPVLTLFAEKAEALTACSEPLLDKVHVGSIVRVHVRLVETPRFTVFDFLNRDVNPVTRSLFVVTRLASTESYHRFPVHVFECKVLWVDPAKRTCQLELVGYEATALPCKEGLLSFLASPFPMELIELSSEDIFNRKLLEAERARKKHKKAVETRMQDVIEKYIDSLAVEKDVLLGPPTAADPLACFFEDLSRPVFNETPARITSVRQQRRMGRDIPNPNRWRASSRC